MIGVSPAYFISRFTDRFTADDIVTSLPDIKAMGYEGFEPEIFHVDTIPTWRNGGAANVRDAAKDVGLVPTQFVAHFMTKGFDSPVSLASPLGLAEIREVVDILDTIGDISVVVVPFCAFPGMNGDLYEDLENQYRDRMVEKLGIMLEHVESSGRKMALEIMPNSLVGGFKGYLELCEQLDTETLGLNMDTGHANAQGEDLEQACQNHGKNMYGTHLCDNHAVENLSLAPGRAGIDFSSVMNTMREAGYEGSWDVEIICNPAEIVREYTAGYQHIRSILDTQQ